MPHHLCPIDPKREITREEQRTKIEPVTTFLCLLPSQTGILMDPQGKKNMKDGKSNRHEEIMIHFNIYMHSSTVLFHT